MGKISQDCVTCLYITGYRLLTLFQQYDIAKDEQTLALV